MPPDPEQMNDRRSEWAAHALDTFSRDTYHRPLGAGEDNETTASDLVADIRHWCDRNGVEWESVLRRAEGHYADETAAPGTMYHERGG